MFKAGEYFIKELLNAGREAIGVGTPVKLNDETGRRFQGLVDNLDIGPDDDQDQELLGLQEEFDPDDTFYIHNIEGDRYQVSRRYGGDYNGEGLPTT